MASTPTFGSTPRLGSLQLSASDTTVAKDFDNFTPAAAGTRVWKIRITTGTTAPGSSRTMLILVNDGTNQRVLEILPLDNTANTFQVEYQYDHFKIPSGQKLQAVMLTTLAASATVDVLVMGEDLT